MYLGASKRDIVMVAVLLTGTLLAVLNQTLLSPALPAIMRDLDVGTTTVQWLTSGYSLVEAIVIPLSAYLIGRFSTRKLFIGSFVIFAIGSLAATLASSFEVLLLGRVLQAVCTGAAMPMVTTVVLLVFPREKRGTAMGIIGLVIGFAPAAGPSVAGLLVDTVGWRVLFAIVFALAVLVTLVAAIVLRNYGDFERTKFDAPSVMLSTVGLVCLLYGLSTFSSSPNLAATFALIATGVVVIIFYVRRQLRLHAPMLNVRILKRRKYAISVGIIVVIQAALMGTGVITPLYIQGVRGYSATMSGIAMLPGALIGAVMGVFAGRLFDRFGARRIAIPGIAVVLLGAFGLAFLGIDSDFLVIMGAYTVLSVGMQFVMTPLNTWGVNSLDNQMIQHAQGLSNTMNQVAGSLGTALLVSVSAMAPALYPDASALEQSYLGDHLAFSTTAAIMVVAAVAIVTLVRERKDDPVREIDGKTAIDYSADFDGITVDEDVLRSSKPFNTELLARDVMNTNPHYVGTDETMAQVVKLMAENDTSAIPIIDDDGRLSGIITDGDVAGYLGSNDITLFDPQFNVFQFLDDSSLSERMKDLYNLNVMSLATKHVVSIDESTSLEAACRVLGEKRIKKVPVLRDGRLVGTLSRRNIVNAIVTRL